ncbi:MAG: pyridoxamine 5'-phosphate oxidase family protein [Bacilli bacterium]|nr:pyridoxamine 5'-phosphate oxidase family protein [Bacilli bacterium]
MENYIYQQMDNKEINDTINKCSICILGTTNFGYPYLVPTYFTYECNNNHSFFVLESKCSGRKIKNILNNNNVCVFIQYNDDDCYKSIIASGIAEISKSIISEKSNMIIIKIAVNEIEGRIYYK